MNAGMSPELARVRDAMRAARAAGDTEAAAKLEQVFRVNYREELKQTEPGEYDPQSREYQKRYGTDLGSGTDRFRAGMGKAFSDLGRGARQFSTELGNEMGLGRVAPGAFGDQEVQRLRDDEAETRERDAPLMATGLGKTGNIVGNVAAAAPAMFVPGANTVAGAAVTGGVMGALQPTVNNEEFLRNTALGVGLGAGGQWLGGRAAQWAGNRLGQRQALASQQQAQNTVRDATIREGIDAGFSVPPATTNPSAMTNALESLSGKAATQQAASGRNQAVTNRLVREDLGMAADEPLTRETLGRVRERAGQVYAQVKQTGNIRPDQQYYRELQDLVDQNQGISSMFPDADTGVDDGIYRLAVGLTEREFTADAAVEMVKRLRSQAKTNFKAAAMGDPAKRQLAQAQWEAAGSMEEMIERHLQSQGLGDLSTAFRAARTTIAKSHSAELALNEGTGNIQASKLMQQLRKGQPMSGGMSTIARFAQAAPKAMAEPTQSGGVSALSAALAAGGVGLGSPGLLAVPAARWLARRALLTPAAQRRIALSNYQPGRAGTSVLRGTRGLGQVAAPLATSVYASEQ